MIFKKKYLLITIFLILIFQSLLYTNNKQKTSFRYFKWTVEEVSIGKLINLSFFSGFLISSFLNSTITSYKKNDFKYIEENYKNLKNEENMNTSVEMPPQRDIRDAQPTISVNYRVVRDMEENNLKNDQNYSNNFDNKDDWDNNDNDW